MANIRSLKCKDTANREIREELCFRLLTFMKSHNLSEDELFRRLKTSRGITKQEHRGMVNNVCEFYSIVLHVEVDVIGMTKEFMGATRNTIELFKSLQSKHYCLVRQFFLELIQHKVSLVESNLRSSSIA